MEKKAEVAVYGCAVNRSTSTETSNYGRHQFRVIGRVGNVFPTAREILRTWSKGSQLGKIIQPDTTSVGCSVTECREDGGAVTIAMACFYENYMSQYMRSYILDFHNRVRILSGFNVVNWDYHLESKADDLVEGCPMKPSVVHNTSIFSRFLLNANVKYKTILVRLILRQWSLNNELATMKRPETVFIGCSLARCQKKDGDNIVMMCIYGKLLLTIATISLWST
ncbi:hypothetical protein DICVIV_11679 [Dictyocaulus viviparus]|uniref:SCP domain-containing protein n=1 Tax=Dictyocaulus viviparus TaxID=29172 RepID=A0A0D8XF67_DICVI|nr:hypothetical protein DICVIV_11679 [Dictyocaulus viviparus]